MFCDGCASHHPSVHELHLLNCRVQISAALIVSPYIIMTAAQGEKRGHYISFRNPQTIYLYLSMKLEANWRHQML